MSPLISKRIIGKHKNNKALYYIKGYFVMWFNKRYRKGLLNKQLKQLAKYNKEYIEKRVDYYNKLENKIQLSKYTLIKEFKYNGTCKTYFLDTFKFIRYFNPEEKLSFEFGDITHIPTQPTIVKSRPIDGDNKNAVILNLNKVRHFLFVKDNKSFLDKTNHLVWRGKVIESRMPHRVQFLDKHFNNIRCNIGAVNPNVKIREWTKERLTIDEQLQFKFILSIEGNDVASNLKWIMSSNSVAVMTKPKYETWFMEGTLIPDFHYIHIKEDYSDLNDKLDYYINHPEKALQIIKNANSYVDQFKNEKQEKLISLLVIKKFFDITE